MKAVIHLSSMRLIDSGEALLSQLPSRLNHIATARIIKRNHRNQTTANNPRIHQKLLLIIRHTAHRVTDPTTRSACVRDCERGQRSDQVRRG